MNNNYQNNYKINNSFLNNLPNLGYFQFFIKKKNLTSPYFCFYDTNPPSTIS